ncbi:2-keto-4-pentenoate hydratase [Nocardioides acrostichi]|uniref:Fumarylacetoacetate hydrolase family protein n=1 Tax=Nocardioides acrostichi TaxID=2784339 RepID=A0A930V4L6_9ACTN|nr:fumarylacetoacetate hydrolase family protein [Nocardioides acrostichi]MBF4163099.1 fumarylacetoacetate hydrolase family protein [Nocardioides acrostichi]
MTLSTPAATTSPSVDQAVERLAVASSSHTPCPPVRDLIGRDDVAAAYAVQSRLVARRIDDGARPVGRKIGLTSPAVQAQLGVDQPDFGVLLDDMAYSDGADLPVDAVLQPRVEAEVAFVLGADLDAEDLGIDDVRSAIEHVVPALEICGSRVAEWDISFGDTVADNASSGAYVLGPQRVPLAEVEPRAVRMTLRINDEEVSQGSGEACLGDPLLAVLWLARQVRELGSPLRAGEVVLAGALGPMRPLTIGDSVAADLTGLGRVAFTYAREEQQL